VSRLKGTFIFALILCSGLFAFAFPAADHSYQWGKVAYEFASTAVLLTLIITPILAHRSLPVWKRILLSVGLAILVNVAWIGGIIATNLKLLGPLNVIR
jgi:hypothetical protein